MKTTLSLDDRILHRTEGRAARDGVTLTEFVEDAPREKLVAEHDRRPAFKLMLRTVHGDGPPGVDISDRDALYNVIDRR